MSPITSNTRIATAVALGVVACLTGAPAAGAADASSISHVVMRETGNSGGAGTTELWETGTGAARHGRIRTSNAGHVSVDVAFTAADASTTLPKTAPGITTFWYQEDHSWKAMIENPMTAVEEKLGSNALVRSRQAFMAGRRVVVFREKERVFPGGITTWILDAATKAPVRMLNVAHINGLGSRTLTFTRRLDFLQIERLPATAENTALLTPPKEIVEIPGMPKG